MEVPTTELNQPAKSRTYNLLEFIKQPLKHYLIGWLSWLYFLNGLCWFLKAKGTVHARDSRQDGKSVDSLGWLVCMHGGV